MTKFEILPTCKEVAYGDGVVRLDRTWGVRDRAGFDGVATVFAGAFGIAAGGERQKHLTLVRDASLGEEEYRFRVATAGIEVAAATAWGFLRARSTLVQLKDGPLLPECRVHDWPRLPIRGIQLMFECFKQMGYAEARDLISAATRLKLNTILMEFGDRFPFQGRHRGVRAPSALTRAEVRKLAAHARANGMQVIPLLQSLGHLQYLLKHDEYADVREEDKIRAQMCPTNEKSFRLFTELADDMLSLLGDCRFMHIGADETRQLGVCPRCRAAMEKTSKGILYATHTNRICEWLSGKGITPLVWDDILCAHPDALAQLHPSAWIVYWDYWTTSSPSPLLVARYDRTGKSHVVCEARWTNEWKGELSTVTAQTLAHFARPVQLETDLSANYLQVYRPCLGAQFPKFVRAFPYLEHYQGKGRTVIGAPTCSGNQSTWHGMPDFPRFGENIHCFAERCIEAKAGGLITTAWYNRVPEIMYSGLVTTAEFAW